MDSLERQTEVNEWAYNSKLETLFMLQLLYLGLVIVLVLTVLTKYGLMNGWFTVMVGLIGLGILLAIWIYRGLYTANVRDKRFWNRRNFTGDRTTPPAVSPDVVAEEAKKRIALYQAAAAKGQTCEPQF